MVYKSADGIQVSWWYTSQLMVYKSADGIQVSWWYTSQLMVYKSADGIQVSWWYTSQLMVYKSADGIQVSWWYTSQLMVYKSADGIQVSWWYTSQLMVYKSADGILNTNVQWSNALHLIYVPHRKASHNMCTLQVFFFQKLMKLFNLRLHNSCYGLSFGKWISTIVSTVMWY